MMNPEVEQSEPTDLINVSTGIESILSRAGIVESREQKEASEKDLNHIQRTFKDAGAGIGDAAIKIAELMESNKGEIALRACETALKVQGVFNDKDKVKMNPTVTINVHNSFSSEGKSLVNLIMPAAQ